MKTFDAQMKDLHDFMDEMIQKLNEIKKTMHSSCDYPLDLNPAYSNNDCQKIMETLLVDTYEDDGCTPVQIIATIEMDGNQVEIIEVYIPKGANVSEPKFDILYAYECNKFRPYEKL